MRYVETKQFPDIHTEEDEKIAEVISLFETSTISLLGGTLTSLYYGLDEFSFSGADRVPGLCTRLSHRLLDRLDGGPDCLLQIRQLCYEIREALEVLDREGPDDF